MTHHCMVMCMDRIVIHNFTLEEDMIIVGLVAILSITGNMDLCCKTELQMCWRKKVRYMCVSYIYIYVSYILCE